MNVRTLCLAILSCGDATGYEIRKLVTEGHFSHFVDASYGSIYPALNRLEKEGLVTSREEHQDGKPTRKVYSGTEAGYAEFLDALSKPAKRDIYKSEFLLQAMCAELIPPQELKRAIDRHVEYLESQLDLIDTDVKKIAWTGADWVANYGRCNLHEALRFIRENRQQLEAVAGTGLPDSPKVTAAE